MQFIHQLNQINVEENGGNQETVYIYGSLLVRVSLDSKIGRFCTIDAVMKRAVKCNSILFLYYSMQYDLRTRVHSWCDSFPFVNDTFFSPSIWVAHSKWKCHWTMHSAHSVNSGLSLTNIEIQKSITLIIIFLFVFVGLINQTHCDPD